MNLAVRLKAVARPGFARLRDPAVVAGAQMALVAVVLAAAWFSQSAHFGVYEDDYNHIARPMSRSWSVNFLRLVPTYTHFFHGRPLGHTFPAVFSKLCSYVGGIRSAYVLAYLLILLNASLFHRWLRLIFGPGLVPFVGALAFVLAPADSTRPFLTGAFFLQPALTFLLLALLLYQIGRLGWAYVLAVASLLTYETLFPLFFVAPLLRRDVRYFRLIRHGLALAVILVIFLALRRGFGDPRLVRFHLPDALTRSLGNFLWGPWYGLVAWTKRTVDFSAAVSPVAFAGMFAALVLAFRSPSQPEMTDPSPQQKAGEKCGLASARVWAAAFLFLVLAYGTDIINSVGNIDGRESRVHMASTLGWSFLIALISARAHRSAYPLGRIAAASALAWVFAACLAYGESVQKDYREAWANQKSFWRQVLALCPDLTSGTVILVRTRGLPRTVHIMSQGWAVPNVLPQLFDLQHSPIAVFPLRVAPRLLLRKEGVVTVTPNQVWGLNEPLTISEEKLIVLSQEGGKLTRMITLSRPLSIRRPTLVPRPLYAEMILE